MNLFVLDLDPKLAAQAHCDKHVVKMVLETAQLLSTAHAHFGEAVYDEALNSFVIQGLRAYKPTHKNHPCAVWVRETAGNYRWALALLEALLSEYQLRYGDSAKKRHKTWEILPALQNPPKAIEHKNFMTPFVTAMPEIYRSDDVVKAYRMYYCAEKFKMSAYKLNNRPEWFAEMKKPLN